MNNFFWPSVDDKQTAERACQTAAGFAWFMGIGTAVLVYLSIAGKIDIGIPLDAGNYIDTVILIVLGLGLFFKSRLAAILALVYVILNRFIMMKGGSASGIFTAIFQFCIFMGGVRGSFAYHEHKKNEAKFQEGAGKINVLTGRPEETPVSAIQPPDKRKRFKTILGTLAMVIVIFAVSAAFFFLQHRKPAKEVSSSAHDPLDVHGDGQAEVAGSRSFKLKSGETVRGKVVLDDPVYYTIESHGVEKIIVKEDIAEEITK